MSYFFQKSLVIFDTEFYCQFLFDLRFLYCMENGAYKLKINLIGFHRFASSGEYRTILCIIVLKTRHCGRIKLVILLVLTMPNE